MSIPPLYVVAAALQQTGHILLATRPQGKPMAGLWEFPGGKCAMEESPLCAIQRELEEELGIIVQPQHCVPLTFTQWALPDGRPLVLLLYMVNQWQYEPVGREGQELMWVLPENMAEYEMPPADAPLVAFLQRLYGVTTDNSAE